MGTDGAMHSSLPKKCSLFLRAALILAMATLPVRAGTTETVIHTFEGGTDGDEPSSPLVGDRHGNLFGVTIVGGAVRCNQGRGCGTVFEISASGVETILHAFDGRRDGEFAVGTLVVGNSDRLYGEVETGNLECHLTSGSCGKVYEISPSDREIVLHTFKTDDHGAFPYGGLIEDAAGNLYGTTEYGGDFNCQPTYGCGTVFRVAPDKTTVVLHAFAGGEDGVYPVSQLFLAKTGNFYGNTESGGGTGCGGYGCGTIFKLVSDGTETILHAFRGGDDGEVPSGPLTMDKRGSLYGTTEDGGSAKGGTVFKISPDGRERVLYSFKGGSDGYVPGSGVIIDRSGNLYGTTAWGGGNGTGCFYNTGCGTVFELAADGTESILYNFQGGPDGDTPDGLFVDKSGNVYGTTAYGGDANCEGGMGCGVVYELGLKITQ